MMKVSQLDLWLAGANILAALGMVALSRNNFFVLGAWLVSALGWIAALLYARSAQQWRDMYVNRKQTRENADENLD